jgi:hypothetical protein
MSMQMPEIYELMEGLPVGVWVAISTEERKVLAYGEDADEVLAKARSMGVAGPFIGRVPQEEETLMFY